MCTFQWNWWLQPEDQSLIHIRWLCYHFLIFIRSKFKDKTMRPPSSYGSMESDSDGEEHGRGTESRIPVFPGALEAPTRPLDKGYSIVVWVEPNLILNRHQCKQFVSMPKQYLVHVVVLITWKLQDFYLSFFFFPKQCADESARVSKDRNHRVLLPD